MLRDEAAKDPRKKKLLREDLPFQDERILINHHIERERDLIKLGLFIVESHSAEATLIARL